MATFRKRNGKWQARIQISGGPTQARTFYKLSDARKWAQQIEEAYQQGLMETRPDPITLYEAFQRYLNDINPRKKRPHIERYRIRAWMQHSLNQRKLEYIRTYHLATWLYMVALCRSLQNLLDDHLKTISNRILTMCGTGCMY